MTMAALGIIIVLLVLIFWVLCVGLGQGGHLQPISTASFLQEGDTRYVLLVQANGDCWLRPLLKPEVRSGSLGGHALFLGNFWSTRPMPREDRGIGTSS